VTEPLRVCVVGSGPAGFYAAGHLLTGAGDRELAVDMLDRLPTPFGLVRSGVAPDHPKIKTVTRVFEKTAAHARFRFFGGVNFGSDVTREELRERYHVIVYATGTAADRPMGIPGEGLPGSWAATDFVGWYNGHPDYTEHEFDLNVERAVVVGNGNVALDVARMLVLPEPELAITDTADYAIAALTASSIREVVILGRRGPAQAAFTNPELRELADLEDVDVKLDKRALADAIAAGEEGLDGTVKRNLKTLQGYAEREQRGAGRRIDMRFLRSPVEVLGDDRVRGVKVAVNELVASPDGTLRARPTGEYETIEAGIVFRAIGYRGIPLPGVPFDTDRGLIANEAGRVTDDGDHALGEYAVGWIKRGPSGVIGTNKKDAQETINHVLADVEAGRTPTPDPALEDLSELLAARHSGVVTYEGWERIDRHERATGEPSGRPRVKLTTLGEMLSIAAQDDLEATRLSVRP
jgi:ferredoxin--NADP+ reductase